MPDLGGEIEHERVELRLDAAGIVGLDLEIVAVRERARVPERDASGFLETSLEQVCRDLARDAGGRHDQPFGVFREELAVHPGLGVEAFGVGE